MESNITLEAIVNYLIDDNNINYDSDKSENGFDLDNLTEELEKINKETKNISEIDSDNMSLSSDGSIEKKIIQDKEEEIWQPLCENMDCLNYPEDWDFEEDTHETYQQGQWAKCTLCSGYFNDNGLGDILFIEEEPNNRSGGCDLCGKIKNIVQMKGTGQYLCGNACDEDEDEDDEDDVDDVDVELLNKVKNTSKTNLLKEKKDILVGYMVTLFKKELNDIKGQNKTTLVNNIQNEISKTI